MDYLGIADLVERFGYTRQGVHTLAKAKDFPAPAFRVNKGRTAIWRLSDIEAFEATHPEVRSAEAKRRKVLGYARALRRGARQEP